MAVFFGNEGVLKATNLALCILTSIDLSRWMTNARFVSQKKKLTVMES